MASMRSQTLSRNRLAKRMNTQSVSGKMHALRGMSDNATITIEPPEHVPLTPSEKFFFDDVIEEFPKLDWTPHRITLAAYMARQMYILDKQQRLYRKEDSLMPNAQGVPTLNPRLRVIDTCAKAMLQIRHSLDLNVRLGTGSASDMAKDATTRMYEDEENAELLPRTN